MKRFAQAYLGIISLIIVAALVWLLVQAPLVGWLAIGAMVLGGLAGVALAYLEVNDR